MQDKCCYLFKLSIIISLLSFIGLSCNDADTDENSFSVRWAGRQAVIGGVVESIYVEGGSGDFTAESSDESIAEVEYKTNNEGEHYINVIAKSKGEVTIYVSDGDKTEAVPVTVVDYYVPMNISGTQALVLSDGKSDTALEMDLMNKDAYFKNENAFILHEDGNNTFYAFKNSDDIKNKKQYASKGVYQFKEINNKHCLVLAVDKKEYVFEITGSQSGIHSLYKQLMPEWLLEKNDTKANAHFLTYTLKEDFTEEYKVRYSDRNISQAVLEYTVLFLFSGDYPVPVE